MRRFKTRYDAQLITWVAVGYCEWHALQFHPQTYFYIV